MAVSMGIYDRLISSITNLFKQFKKSVISLLPIGIGCVIGLVGFTYAIQYLLANQPFPTCLAFIGMILGGVPILEMCIRDSYKDTLFAYYPSTDPAAYLASIERIAVLPVKKVFPAHHDLNVQPALIQDMKNAFTQLKVEGRLHHGSGIFKYKDFSIWI